MGKNDRDLTSLEYLVLGLMSIEPQSGYTIINYFEDGSNGWSASPGSVYPMLKRLEKQDIIVGNLDMEHETRPKKIYTLTEIGEELLDSWLREVPSVAPLYQQREEAVWRFQFMEHRLSREEVLAWIDNYLDSIRIYDYGRRLFSEGTLAAMENEAQPSIHNHLVIELTLMEINTLRTWLEMARARIAAAPPRED